MALTKSQFLSAFHAAPYAARELLLGEAFGVAMTKIATKNSIGTEAKTLLSEHTTEMLLGVMSPKEFVERLKAGGMSESLALSIAKDVNDLVLKPVHAAQQEGEEVTADLESIQKTVVPNVPPKAVAQPATPPSTTVPKVIGAVTTPTPVSLPAAPAHAALPKPHIQPVMRQATPSPSVPARAVVPAGAPAPLRTMAKDVETMHDKPVAPVVSPAKTEPVVPTIAVTAPKTPPPSPAKMTNAAVAEEMKLYGVDPYREPVE